MKYIIYCRKSTDTEDKQVLSLESQENELVRLAKSLNLEVFKILKESKSAKDPGRPVFDEMIKIISSGKADAILCWKIDRLTRNPVDGGQIQWLLQNNKIKCITTFEKNYLPTDNVVLMSIEQGMANQYIRELSANVKRGNRAKLERGEWPNHPPLGYLNDKANKTIIVDKRVNKYITKAFEYYKTGTYSLINIADKLYSEGLRTNTGNKVRRGQFHKIFNNPFYCGDMMRDGKVYKGKHQPIISKEVFAKTQDLLNNRSRPRPKTLFFPLRGFMKCDVCGCSLTASTKKGHHYYYCTNRKEICAEHKSYMRENYLYEIFADILGNIAFSERKIDLIYKSAKEMLDKDNDYTAQILQNLRTELEALSNKEKKLLDAFLSEQISKDLYDVKTRELKNEHLTLSSRIRTLESQQPALMLEPTKKVFLQASRAKKEFLTGDDLKKRNILENLCWNLSIKNKNVAQLKLKSPFNIMYKTPKNSPISTLLGDRESNPN